MTNQDENVTPETAAPVEGSEPQTPEEPQLTLEQDVQSFTQDLLLAIADLSISENPEDIGEGLRIVKRMVEALSSASSILGVPAFADLLIPASLAVKTKMFAPEATAKLKEQTKVDPDRYVEYSASSFAEVAKSPKEAANFYRAVAGLATHKAEQFESDAD